MLKRLSNLMFFAVLLGLAACAPEGGDFDIQDELATVPMGGSPDAIARRDRLGGLPTNIDFDLCATNPSICYPLMGRGWNAVTDTDGPSLLTCLEAFSVSNPGLTGATVTSKVRFATSTVDVKDSMRIDGRVSGSVPAGEVPVAGSLFGEASRTAKATQSALTLLVHTKIEFAPLRISSVPKVSATALSRFDVDGRTAFRNLCGDRFVESITMGAEFFAVIQMSSSNTSVQSKLKASLSAALGSGQNPATAVDTTLDTVNANPNAQLGVNGSVTGSFQGSAVEVRIEVLQRGGSITTNPTTPQEIITRFALFPSLVTSQSQLVPMGFGLMSYTQASNWGTRTPFSILGATDAVTQVLGPAYAAYFDAYNELAFALSHTGSNMYFPFDENAAAALMNESALKLAAIESELDRCGRGGVCNATTAANVAGTQWPTLRSRLPVRKQLYKVASKTFMDGAALRGAISTKGWEGYGTGGSCNIDTDLAQPTGNVRIWTASGVGGTGCRYKLFNRGRLTGLWDVHAMNFDFSRSGNTMDKLPSKDDLTLSLYQFSLPWQFAKGYTFDITLAGPAGDETSEPWRQAISTF